MLSIGGPKAVTTWSDCESLVRVGAIREESMPTNYECVFSLCCVVQYRPLMILVLSYCLCTLISHLVVSHLVVSHLVVSHLTTLLCSHNIYLLFCLATLYLGEIKVVISLCIIIGDRRR